MKSYPVRLSVNGILILSALSVLGLFGNYYKVELFFNVDFLFGSIFAIFAVRVFGLSGVAVGFIASLYTYILWNHPYAIIIFTCESLFVAVFLRKSKNIVLLDLLYWLLAGIPIIFITYYLIMKMPLSITMLIMMKQSINGIFGSLVASIIYDIYNYYRKNRGFSYQIYSLQHFLFQIMTLIIAVPVLFYVIVSVKSSTDFVSKEMQSNFNTLVRTTQVSLENFMEDNLNKIEYLADTAGHYDISLMSQSNFHKEIADMLESSTYFIDMGIITPDMVFASGVSMENSLMHYHSGYRFNSSVLENLSSSSERMYISGLETSSHTKRPIPVIYVIKPILDKNGELLGYAQGSLDFQSIKRYLIDMSAQSGIDLYLLDRNEKIILSTLKENLTGKALTEKRGAGTLQNINSGIKLWAPEPEKNVSIMTTWKNSYYVKEVKVSDSIPIKISAEMPLNSYVEYMNNTGRKALFVIFILVIAAVSITYLISKKLTSQITLLGEISRNLPEKIDSGENVVWPETIVEETVTIIDSFKYLGSQLGEKYNQINEKTDELDIILDNIPLLIFLKDTENNFIRCNKRAAQSLGIRQEEIAGKPCRDYFPRDYELYYKDDLSVIRSKKAKHNITERFMSPVEGDRKIKASKMPIFNSKGNVDSVLVIIEDITDEVESGKEKSKMLDMLNHQAKMAEVGAMLSMIVHQWMQPLNVINIVADSIKEYMNDPSADKESVKEEAVLLGESVSFLLQTVTDFNDYFKKNKEMVTFDIAQSLTEVFILLEKHFMKNGIKVDIQKAGSFQIRGLKNELKQVFLNLFNNVIDAHDKSAKKEKYLRVTFEAKNGEGVIRFSDNAGGIQEKLLPDELFEPYVSSKGVNGSGIGLFISRNIIENNMEGKITAVNKNDGAEFTITLPLEGTLENQESH